MIEVDCFCEYCTYSFTTKTNDRVHLIEMKCPRCKRHMRVRFNRRIGDNDLE